MNMRNLFVFLMGFVVMMTSLISHAQNNTPTTQKKVKNLFFCPPTSALKKDPVKLTWSAQGLFQSTTKKGEQNGGVWKSHEISFVNKISEFLGAQWNGETVGQITCLYKGKMKTSFPILLVFNILTLEPSGASWSKNLGGYRNCVARKRSQCPFKIRVKPKPGDIYQEAEQLKSDSNNFPNSGD